MPAMGYCWEEFGPRLLHCCRPPGHDDEDGRGGHWTPYGGDGAPHPADMREQQKRAKPNDRR